MKKTVIHDLKIRPSFFNEVMAGIKQFEVRKSDRNYQVGDLLRLHEQTPCLKNLTGNSILVQAKYILGGDEAVSYGISPYYVVIGITPVTILPLPHSGR